MSNVVLDSSAAIAIIAQEKGADAVMAKSQGAFISAVNLAEIYSKSADLGFTLEELQWAVTSLQLISVAFDDDMAAIVGSLREPTRKFGLSLGDRACLALAWSKKLPVLTADSAWKKLKIGVDIEIIR